MIIYLCTFKFKKITCFSAFLINKHLFQQSTTQSTHWRSSFFRFFRRPLEEANYEQAGDLTLPPHSNIIAVPLQLF